MKTLSFHQLQFPIGQFASSTVEDVLVPRDPAWKYRVNLAIQSTAMVLYIILLVYVLHNTYRYVVVAKRYKVLTHALFYTFAILLAICRII